MACSGRRTGTGFFDERWNGFLFRFLIGLPLLWHGAPGGCRQTGLLAGKYKKSAFFRKRTARGRLDTATPDRSLSAEVPYPPIQAGFLACGSTRTAPSRSVRDRTMADCSALPVYSDRIAREFHPIPFSPGGCRALGGLMRYKLVSILKDSQRLVKGAARPA